MRYASMLVIGATIATVIACTWQKIIPWLLSHGD